MLKDWLFVVFIKALQWTFPDKFGDRDEVIEGLKEIVEKQEREIAELKVAPQSAADSEGA